MRPPSWQEAAVGKPMYIPPPGALRSRRSFLKRGVWGGLLLGLSGTGFLALRGSKLWPAPAQPLQYLDLTEYSVLHAIAARLLPCVAPAPTTLEVDVGLEIDRALDRLDASAVSEIKNLLRLFENGLAGFLFGRRTKPFTQLAPEDQDAVLREWQDSRLVLRRTGFTALRTLVMGVYFATPATWKGTGYPGPPAFHQPGLPVWKGGAEPRPLGNGTWVEPSPAPAPEPSTETEP